MNKIILALFCALLLVVSACKGEQTLEQKLDGTWKCDYAKTIELRKASGFEVASIEQDKASVQTLVLNIDMANKKLVLSDLDPEPGLDNSYENSGNGPNSTNGTNSIIESAFTFTQQGEQAVLGMGDMSLVVDFKQGGSIAVYPTDQADDPIVFVKN